MLAALALSAVEVAALLAVGAKRQAMKSRTRSTPPPAEKSAPTEAPPAGSAKPPAADPKPPPAPGTVAPFARPSPPLEPIRPEKPDWLSEAAAIKMGSRVITGVMAWTPFAPVAPLFAAIGEALASWNEEAERSKKVQPFLIAMRRYALTFAPYQAIMERWPTVDALYDRGDWDGCKRAEADARGAGAQAYRDVCANLDASELKTWRDFVKNKKNAPAFFSSWDAVIYSAWSQGAGFTGYPKRLLVPIDEKTNGEWVYTSLVDGVSREYSPLTPDAPGVVRPHREISPEQLAKNRAAFEERQRVKVLEEQTGQAPGQRVRDLKESRRNGNGLEEQLEDVAPLARTAPTTTPPPAPAPAPKPTPPPPAPTPAPAPVPAPLPRHPLIPTSNKKGGDEVFTQWAGEESVDI